MVTSADVSPTELRRAGAELAAECARYAAMGWMRGTSGNLSLRLSGDPLRLAITASGLDKAELSEQDIVVIDAAGEAVGPPPAPSTRPPAPSTRPPARAGAPVPASQVLPAGTAAPVRRPSAEAGLHARIASVAGAGAVVHVHALAATLAAERWPAGVPLRDLEILKGIGRSAHDDLMVVPVIANSQDMRTLGAAFTAVFRPDTPAFIVARHGVYVWGDDLRHARQRLECLEWALRFTGALR